MSIRSLRLGTFAAGMALLVSGSNLLAQSGKTIDILKVGTTAPDVEFQPLVGEQTVKLSELTNTGPVVLVVLRGYPGYQCPICARQVRDLISHADKFESLGAKVVLVYPGPADDLTERAKEFLRDTELPQNFLFMIDPDYAFTRLYDLRWDAPRETAYPSTFVLDKDRVVKFRTVSTSHGGRAKTTDVLGALDKIAGANAN
jgi:thioredoxin-dependent peroxiredoxin